MHRGGGIMIFLRFWYAASSRAAIRHPAGFIFMPAFLVLIMAAAPISAASGNALKLQELIGEAIKNNPEIQAGEARTKAAEHRISQAASLADPMFMVGYENEGTSNLYTFNRDVNGMPADSRWMFSLSQVLPYPGKLALKGAMTARDAETLQAMTASIRLNTILRVKELYYDLFLAYTTIDLLHDKALLFSRTEEAALARYATGMGPQQEILMAQTEKYMLLEREEMEKQKIQSLEAMLNAALGRDGSRPLGGRPEMPFYKPYTKNLDELIKESRNNNPMIRAKDKMAAASEARVQMAKKEFYPDLTVGGTYYARGEQYPDMWNLTATVNIPLFYKKKQEQGVLEAESTLQEAQKDVEATRAMVFSTLRDNYAMVKAAESLMALYKRGLILKVYQDFESALAGYTSGKVEAITVISRLKTLIDYELSYWNKFVEREKAIARLQAVAGIMDYEAGTK